MLLTVVFFVVLVSLIAVGYSRLGNKQEGNHQGFGPMQVSNDYPVVSGKRDLADAAASFLFIIAMSARMQRNSKKKNW